MSGPISTERSRRARGRRAREPRPARRLRLDAPAGARRSPRCTASASAAACRSRSAPTSASPRPTRSSRSWRSAGAWCPTWRSRRRCRGLVRTDVARELIYTGRRVSGEEAARDRARHARRRRPARGRTGARRRHRRPLARRDPRRQAAACNDAWPGDAREALLLETELQVALIGSPNQLAAVTAGLTQAARRVHRPRLSAAAARGRGAAMGRVRHHGCMDHSSPARSVKISDDERGAWSSDRPRRQGDGPPRPRDLTTRCRVLSPVDRMRYSPGSLVVVVSPSPQVRDQFTARVFEDKGLVLSPSALRKLIAGRVPDDQVDEKAAELLDRDRRQAPGGGRQRRRRARRARPPRSATRSSAPPPRCGARGT